MAIHLAKWSDRDWTLDRIDRFFSKQNYRLSAGLAWSRDLTTLHGCLAVYQGRGKYTQLKQASFLRESLPAHQLPPLSLLEEPAPRARVADLLAWADDLAPHQIRMVEQIQGLAGKYIDRILAVTLDDQVYRCQDFDGVWQQLPFYQASRIAEHCGCNVIDAISERDINAGGSGKDLDALPLWLIFAHRNAVNPQLNQTEAAARWLCLTSATEHRRLRLPPSDGLDEFLPEIEIQVGTWDANADCKSPPAESRQLAGAHDSSVREAVDREPSAGSPLLNSPEAIFIGARPGGGQQLAPPYTSLPLANWGLPDELLWDDLRGLVASCWGILFADQTPGNVPVLTGATSQRILGRVTPGKPAVWRHLLLHMNDCTAPTMRLRDAV